MKIRGKKNQRKVSISLIVIAIFVVFLSIANFSLIFDFLSMTVVKIMKNEYFKNYLVMHEIKKLDAVTNFNNKDEFYEKEK